MRVAEEIKSTDNPDFLEGLRVSDIARMVGVRVCIRLFCMVDNVWKDTGSSLCGEVRPHPTTNEAQSLNGINIMPDDPIGGPPFGDRHPRLISTSEEPFPLELRDGTIGQFRLHFAPLGEMVLTDQK